MRALKRVLIGVAALAVVADGSTPAYAHSDSSKYYYPGGDYVQANVWIQSFSWSGCGDWQTSAYLHGYNPPTASWIKNIASFHADGVGASVHGVGLTGGGTSASQSSTNYNNWEADLAGNVCGNWLTWYIEASSTAITYVPQYGSPRSAVASV
jgi:hypothetical protein